MYLEILKQMIPRHRTSQIPPLEEPDGELVMTERDKAATLNANIAGQSTSEILANLPPPIEPNFPDLSNIKVTVQEIVNALNMLNVNKSYDPDVLPNNMTKLVDLLVYEPLKKLLNKFLSEGKFAISLKRARVTTIFKNKGSKPHPTNYRQISLLPGLSFLEHVFKRIYQRLTQNELLSETQSGFRPTYSTQQQLPYLSHKTHKALDDNIDFTVKCYQIPSEMLPEVSFDLGTYRTQRGRICQLRHGVGYLNALSVCSLQPPGTATEGGGGGGRGL